MWLTCVSGLTGKEIVTKRCMSSLHKEQLIAMVKRRQRCSITLDSVPTPNHWTTCPVLTAKGLLIYFDNSEDVVVITIGAGEQKLVMFEFGRLEYNANT